MKVIIIGGGQVGAYIANLLLKDHCDVKVIENRECVLDKLKNDLPHENIVVGSGTDPNVLEAAGIAKADVVAAVAGTDEANLVAATICKFEFAVPRVLARVNNPKNAWLFNAGMGVDVCLNQADLVAHIIVEEMNLDTMLTLMKLGNTSDSIIQVKIGANSAAEGKCIKELVMPKNTLIVAIYRGTSTVIPHGDTTLEKDDNLIIFADESDKEKINLLFSAAAELK